MNVSNETFHPSTYHLSPFCALSLISLDSLGEQQVDVWADHSALSHIRLFEKCVLARSSARTQTWEHVPTHVHAVLHSSRDLLPSKPALWTQHDTFHGAATMNPLMQIAALRQHCEGIQMR